MLCWRTKRSLTATVVMTCRPMNSGVPFGGRVTMMPPALVLGLALTLTSQLVLELVLA